MKLRWILAALSLSGGALAQPAKFTLELPEIYHGEFELGGSLRISRQPVKKAVFRLYAAAVEIHDVEIQINGQTMDTIDAVNAKEKRFEVVSRSDLFEQGKPTIVSAIVRGAERFNNQWTIARHDKPWAVELQPAGSSSIRIELDRPNRALLAGIDTQEQFAGLLMIHSDELKSLFVAGVPAQMSAKTGMARFDAKVSFGPDMKSVVIAAEGAKGSAARLHYPLLQGAK